MYAIEYSHHLLTSILVLFFYHINMITSNDDNHRFETIYRSENDDVNFRCDLTDVAWWKRPNLIATRYGIILPKFRSKISLQRTHDDVNLQILNIAKAQSSDAGIYECETLGAIRQYHLVISVRLTAVEFGAQLISSYDSTNDHSSNQTDHNLLHQSLRSNNGSIYLREHQLIRLTCVVSRAIPAAILHFPFDFDYHVERNSTIENEDKTYRTILVLTFRISRYYHKRTFHCEATQIEIISTENEKAQHRVLSNSLQMDVAYSPICSRKVSFVPEYSVGLHRPINLTCHMNNGNPSRINFTWHLPNGNTYLGVNLDKTSNYLTLKPNRTSDFGKVTCRAQNELGLFGECHFNMMLGGIPDPISSCHYTYLNTTLTVNCVAGFHQGDEDFFCYMYKRQQNGLYSEHARLKSSCAFIVPGLKPELNHDFRVFTQNKFGSNYNQSYSIQVGKPRESFIERAGFSWPFTIVFIAAAIITSLILICYSCHKLRKFLSDKRKSATTATNFENLTYRNHNSNHMHDSMNGKASLVYVKQNGYETTYPIRPYRSKDYLKPSETYGSHYKSSHAKNTYPTDDEVISNRRSAYKETDLDSSIQSLSNERVDGTISSMKTLPINRNRTVYSPSDTEKEHHHDESNPYPGTMQRRSSFQVATKQNSLDFYPSSDSFFTFDKQLVKPVLRNPYSPERDLRERERFRDKRTKADPARQTNLIVENRMLTNDYSNAVPSQNDPSWREMNLNNDYNQENARNNKNFILSSDEKQDDRPRDEGIFV